MIRRPIFPFIFVCAVQVFAQDRLLTVDDIYDPKSKINFSGSPPLEIRWFKDREHYLQHKRNKDESAAWLKVHARSGESETFLNSEKMRSAFAQLPDLNEEEARELAKAADFELNPQETAILVSHAGDLFYYELLSSRAARLTKTPQKEEEAEFSPDGQMVSFIRDYDLYVLDVADGRERRLTVEGSSELLNGRLDWIYQEEVYGRGDFKGYWWSPDSTRIAYLQLDESEVPKFTILDHIPTHLETERTHYPKAGDPNPAVRLGVVQAAGGETLWTDDSKYREVQALIVRVSWTPDGSHLVYQVQDREQTWLDLNLAEVGAPSRNAADRQDRLPMRTLLRETSPAWVEQNYVNDLGIPAWLKDGSLLWMSERSGWRHLYHFASDGKLIGTVTSGEWEIRVLYGVDQREEWVYFSSTEYSHIAPHIYRARLDASRRMRLSEREGTHEAQFNPDFTLYIDSWSDISTPTQVRLHAADGSQVRVIDENNVSVLKEFKLGKPEFLKVKTRDGFVMEALMIKPPDFDPTKKYPVMSQVYGGPSLPIVRNSWGASTYMWHQLLAQRGFIVWILDNRSASGKGAQSAWPVYKKAGALELRDLEDGLNWLKSQPYVDGSRIGIWGWSYGGFMSAYALTHSQSFKIGIAGAPVTDWRLYDTIYTERFMSTPEKNPEGYDQSSVVKAAANLHGKLLLLHGTLDDNVHLQNSIQFIYELQKAGNQFALMLYPQSRHGVRQPLLTKHLRTLMTNFILENL